MNPRLLLLSPENLPHWLQVVFLYAEIIAVAMLIWTILRWAFPRKTKGLDQAIKNKTFKS